LSNRQRRVGRTEGCAGIEDGEGIEGTVAAEGDSDGRGDRERGAEGAEGASSILIVISTFL
jgi:hypothetical protein